MSKPFRALCVTGVLLLVALSVMMTFTLNVVAASFTWTTDTDFTQSGAGGSVPVFTGTHVSGTGTPALVELNQDVLDWASKNPTGTPGGREGPGMVYASQAGESILFGGHNSSCSCDKPGTFAYNYTTNTWSQITTTGAPPGREWPGLSYDPVRNIVVLFGGANSTNGFLNDTWEFDVATSTWTQYNPSPAPPVLVDNPLVYDIVADRHVVVGGTLSNQMQTWAYDAGAHGWANQNPSGLPSFRSGFRIAYHASLDRVVLFGGAFFQTLYADTYEYNYGGHSWSLIAPAGQVPSARAGPMMTYHAPDTAVYLFGGFVNPGVSQETFKYTASRQWALVSTNHSPPARQMGALVVDPVADVGLLFGGSDATGAILGDTWRLGSSFEAAGIYKSAIFDSGGANVVWGNLWWNRTPANQPLNTFLRFQIATADNTNPLSFTYWGPSCTSSSYFTSPPASIPTCFNNHRYLTFLASFGTFDTTVTPLMEDVTIDYVVPPSPPYIVATDPADVTFGVPSDKVVNITFSKPMNPANFSVAFLAGPPVAFVPSWTDNNTVVHLAHATPFTEAKVYRLQVTATDVPGASLIPNPVDPSVVNPWTFVILAIHPTIQNVTPFYNQGDVPVNTPVVYRFSEPMNTSNAVATSTPNIAFTQVWSNNDQTLTLNHPNFATCTQYTVQMNATDKSNLALVPGPVNNPTTFFSHCPNPYLTTQVPANDEGNVAQNAAVDVDFSEPMQTGSVTFVPSPPVSGGAITWSNGNRHLHWTHSTQFPTCTVYTITITGRDADENLSLIQNPFNPSIQNPWTFVTMCNNPFIMWTKPANNAVNWSITQEFQILFYPPPPGQMNTASVVYTVTGGPYRETNVSWDVGTLMHIQHLPLRECTAYTMQVTQARNANGANLVAGPAANPWHFNTECVSPYVTNTNPANNTVLVPVNRPIFVNFSAAMDTASVVFNPNPPITGQSFTWSNGNRTLRIDHADMAPCQVYQVIVDGNGADGRALLTGGNAPAAPDPWSFTTKCAGFYIAQTDPANLQTDVPFAHPINITFSVAANPGSLVVNVVPAVGTLTPTWSGGNTVVSVAHASLFSDCIQYTVTVTATDTLGNPLNNSIPGASPNPWTFKAHCVPPQIVNTVPTDGAVGVPLNAQIVVTFSEAIQTATVTLTINPAIATSRSWNSPTNTVLTLSHATAFTANTQYCVQITAARDVDNNNLAAGPVPNPWCFTTASGIQAPSGFNVARSGADVNLSWRPVTGAATYVVYSATTRLQAWPWPVLTTVTAPATSYLHTGAWNDGATHFYIVRARDAGGATSTNSTMGVKTPLTFTVNAGRTNIYWISIPYRTKYHTAKDISDELTSADITLVGKWVPSTQSSIQWIFFRGSWRGVNFPINPGDGIFIGIRTTFPWVINGTDGAIAHTFTLYPAPNANRNWISLPYTSVYTKASDLVIDIEGSLGPNANTRIVEVGKWDPATQSTVIFSWSAGVGWVGTDFTLSPGEAIYFKVNSSFTWTPRLITPEV